jgi:hypothetical protein
VKEAKNTHPTHDGMFQMEMQQKLTIAQLEKSNFYVIVEPDAMMCSSMFSTSAPPMIQ